MKECRKKAIEENEIFGQMKNIHTFNPDFSKWWRNDGYDQNKAYASDEALRKYYSVKEYLTHGTPRVCTPALLRLDLKFGDQKENLWLYHISKPLEDTITRYSMNSGSEEMRIVTSWDEHQQEPRLLVISVDVKDGKTVTFDSYHKVIEDPCNSLYDRDGITINHVMASGTLPEFYDF